MFFHKTHWLLKTSVLCLAILVMVPLAGTWGGLSGSVGEDEDVHVLKDEIQTLKEQLNVLVSTVQSVGNKTGSGTNIADE